MATSREALIAKQLSGLPFISSPETQEEIKQSIMDYFCDDGMISSDDESDGSSDEQEIEAQPAAGISSTSVLWPSASEETTEISVFDVGVHNLGDEGLFGLVCKKEDL